MKIRSLKLREAHGGDVASFCSVLWDRDAQRLVTASSSEASILIHDALLLSTAPTSLRHHRGGVTALALSPNSTCLASGSIDHSVKLYKFPGGEFVTNITRFVLPIRALDFNKSGSMLAAAGDDEGIKLINTVDGTISRVLKGHKGSVTGLAFDPNGEYLASVDSMGTVIFWELQSGNPLHILKSIAPDTRSDASFMNVLCWSPDAETLAVPGLKNDVVMYDRDTAEKLFSLRGDHVQPVCFLSWSPNGKYMATSSLDKQVLIWDVDQRQDIDRQKFEDRICCMAWKPTGNALAVIDVMGKYGVWDSAVPPSMKSPTADAPCLKSRTSNGILLFDEEDQEPSASGSLSDIGEHSHEESEPLSRKRLRKQPSLVDDLDEHIDDELSFPPKTKFPKRSSLSRKDKSDTGKEREQNVAIAARPIMQMSFQPGATHAQTGKRRFLCYNMLGCITTIEHEGYCHIEIDFHDTNRGPRVPSMTDYFGFTMASLNENGSVFANPCKGEKNMSTLMYRPFGSWANNSEWSMRFEEEEVKVVALGFGWVVAVTSLNFLRVFTEGGLQKIVISLDGPVVTASGFKDKLAVVTHASHCLPSNDQMLEFQVFNISEGTRPLKGHLPLTPGSNLTWFGFSEEGQLSSYDSKGVLRVFTDQFGGSWLPLFSAIREKSKDTYWVVGLDARNLFCIVCKTPDLFPQVVPKPVLTLLKFSFPLASSDLGAEALENEFILNNMHLSKIQRRIDQMATSGLDTASLEDDAFNIEAAQDRCILRLIASCCNGDKLVRATELVKLLALDKSVQGAIKLVTALKLPNLAERFNSILEERMLNEVTATEAIKIPAPKSNAFIRTEAFSSKDSALPECSKTPDSALHLPSTKLSTPLLVKRRQTQEEAKAGEDDFAFAKCTNATSPDVPMSTPKLSARIFLKKRGTQEATKHGKEKTEENLSTNIESRIKVKNAGEASSAGKVHQVLPGRPSNPFAKTPTNTEKKASLFDSIKKNVESPSS